MKVTVEVDISSQEIPAATELFRALSQVAVPHPQVGLGAHEKRLLCVVPLLPNPRCLLSPAAMELFRALRLFAEQVKVRNATSVFRDLVKRLADPSTLDAVLADTLTALGPAATAPPQATPQSGASTGAAPTEQEKDPLLQAFLDAFLEVLFDTSCHPTEGLKKTVQPFLQLLPRLPEYVRTELANACKKEVTRKIREKRPVQRQGGVYQYADAFAGLVLLDYISVNGSLSVMSKLMEKPECQAASVMCLARTVELCYQKLQQQADPEAVKGLLQAVRNVDPSFQYEVEYITSILGNFTLTPQPSSTTAPPPGLGPAGPYQPPNGGAPRQTSPMPAGATGPVPGVPRASPPPLARAAGAGGTAPGAAQQRHYLRPDKVFPGSAKIHALTWDRREERIVAASADGLVNFWDLGGTVAASLDLRPDFVAAMDMMPRIGSLFACVVDSTRGKRSIVRYEQGAHRGGAWREEGRLQCDSVTCIKALGGESSLVVTGERSNDGGAVVLYDATQAQPHIAMHVRSYTEQALVSCLANVPASNGLFLAGFVDNCMRLYDSRESKAVGVFGTPQPAPANVAPSQFVTSVDCASDILVVSGSWELGGQEGAVQLWDLRSLRPNAAPVLRHRVHAAVMQVAVGPTLSTVAYSTAASELFLSDLETSGAAPACVVGRDAGRSNYLVLKWAKTQHFTLFGAEGGNIHSYSLEQTSEPTYGY